MTAGTSHYDQLRRDILTGAFAPGDPLRLSALSKRYDVSPTPLREALSRLEAKRLVVGNRNRGWQVAPVSLAHLEDIAAARITLEKALTAEAIAGGGVDWEAGIVSAHHRLAQTPEPDAQADAAARENWRAAHDAFHIALISAARSDWLIGVYSDLIEQLQRYHDLLFYRRGAVPDRLGQVHSIPNHTQLRDAFLARDTGPAQALMTAHVALTLELYRAAMDG